MKLNKEFFSFVVAGGIAAIVNFISRIILNNSFSFEVSVVCAYVIGMVTAYILNRYFVFKSNSSIALSCVKFIVVNVVAVLQTYFISVYLYKLLQEYTIWIFQKEVAHFVGISVPVFTSYIGHKYWSFRSKD